MFEDDKSHLYFECGKLEYKKQKKGKKGLFGQVAILEFSQRGDPMNLVQNSKTTLWSAFGRNTPRNNFR